MGESSGVESKRHKRTTLSTLDIPKTVSSLDTIPHCKHGAALTFTRTDANTGTSRGFYACSMTRDRKVCNLFHWIDEWERKLKRQHSAVVEHSVPSKEARLSYSSREKWSHEFVAKTDNKTNAQYLFDPASVDIITSIIKQGLRRSLLDQRVLCIGTPFIHKALIAGGYNSTLLDEDERLSQLYPQTYRFNAFNGSWLNLDKCPINDDYSVIVIDPPFHPELLPALFHTLELTVPNSLSSALVLMAFPYFNADKVRDSFNRFVMNDIRLTYCNHKKFATHDRSPVRLYSSLPIGRMLDQNTNLDLPGHWNCDKCKDFVSHVNVHCNCCNKCTTLTGSKPYRHCADCGKCVKPSSEHCNKCRKCFLVPHSC